MGVHKRLACSEMVACQLSQRAPSCTEFIAKARKILSASTKQRKLVCLATDDMKATWFCGDQGTPNSQVDCSSHSF